MSVQPLTFALPLSRIVGRDDELAAIEILLRDARLVTIVGLGGIGKSRLAAEVVARVVVHRPAYVVDLDGLGALSHIESRIATVIGCPTALDAEPAQALVDRLATMNPVLVLDGLDDVPDASRLIERILAQTESSVLVTSRRPLRIRGEREFPLGPLPVPEAATEVAAMERPACVLFIREAERFGVSIGPLDGPAIVAIVRYLDGWPLLIELAAARTRLFPPQVMAVRLQRDLPTLPRSGTEGDAIDAAIDWVLDPLDAGARARVIELGIFPRRFGLDALAAIWEQDP